MSDRTKLVHDAGLFCPRLISDLVNDRGLFQRSVGTYMFQRPLARQPKHMAGWAVEPTSKLVLDRGSLATELDVRSAIWEEWASGPMPCDEEHWRSRGIIRIDLGLSKRPDWLAVAAASAAVAVIEKTRRDRSSPLVVPCYPPSVDAVLRSCGFNARPEHVLVRIDIGRFLLEPPPGIETWRLIDFRVRYRDERERLVRAIEQLIEHAVVIHGWGEPADIERAVYEEIEEALADLRQAGKHIFRGSVRRAGWFAAAWVAGEVGGPAAGAAASVAANWSSERIPLSTSAPEFTYLYRLQRAHEDFARMAT